MSSASSSPTARAIHRCTVAVWRRRKAAKASSSPWRAEASSSSSVFSGWLKGESHRAGGDGAILRRIRPAPSAAGTDRVRRRARIHASGPGRRARPRAAELPGGRAPGGTRSGSRCGPRASGPPRTSSIARGRRSGRRSPSRRRCPPRGAFCRRAASACGAAAGTLAVVGRGGRLRRFLRRAGGASSLHAGAGSRRRSRKNTASIVPTLEVSPSHCAYDFAVSVKKNLRAVWPETCQPGMSAVSPGERTHLVAASSVVRLASITLRPSTESATAIRSEVGLESRITKSLPLRAST